MSEQSNIETVQAFCDAWETGDLAALVAYFAEDAVYHNIPFKPINGRPAIEKALGGMTGDTKVVFEVLGIAANDDLVFTERVDYITTGEKQAALPVAGVFRLRDNKITEWRDYFDVAMFSKAMGN